MSAKFLSRAVLICWISSLSVAVAQVRGPADVVVLEQHETSEPLRNIPPLPPQAGQHMKPVYHIPHSLGPAQPDPALQTQAGASAAPATMQNFDGVGNGFSGPGGTFSPDAAPPDTNGAVGDTQYVQWVNESFAVFDKATGAVLYGPAAGNTLFQNMGGHKCQTTNDGDPIVQYDKAAKRWIMTQFAVSGGAPYYQCIAISTTPDATGPYYRYVADQPNFNDYPKVGVWPDAYYITFNMFTAIFQGARVCALDRSQMLAGQSANMQCFQFSSSIGGLLPADLDGSTPPPAGAPNYLVNFGSSSLRLWKFHVDFTNSVNSSVTGPATVPVAAFSQACNGGTCIPQLGTSQLLDSLGDRLMYRLAYRNFGDHEALVVNHSIATPNGVGVRWYEVRNPNGTPTLYQQGTYAPDANYRWMGSIAMDHVGNAALGYSVSSTTMKPSIAYAGRTPADPLGTLGAETTIINGSGSQLMNLNRWGDYSAMSIDPVDDCTFWYTTEYLQSDGTFNWNTRIANFKFSSCGSTPPPADFAVSATPSSNTVPVGSGTSYTVTATSLQGFTGAVTFSISGLPAGASGSFSPASVTPTGNSTLTITTSSSTPAGPYPLTITGTSGSLVHSTSVTLVVTAPTTDFGISASPSSQTISRGNTAAYTVTLTRQNGFSGTVNLSVTGLPNGSSAAFNPASVSGTTSTLTIKTSRGTKTGPSTLTITGTSGSLSHSTPVTLILQ